MRAFLRLIWHCYRYPYLECRLFAQLDNYRTGHRKHWKTRLKANGCPLLNEAGVRQLFESSLLARVYQYRFIVSFGRSKSTVDVVDRFYGVSTFRIYNYDFPRFVEACTKVQGYNFDETIWLLHQAGQTAQEGLDGSLHNSDGALA